jgi:8-oxo-dGTP pyrophosphatase MutT (NUDIX family)
MSYNKKISLCLNCNKFGHEQKQCKEPIKSWGILLVRTNNNINYTNTDIKKYENLSGLRIYDKENLRLISENMGKIKFLLVRRKHSLGFSEFMRGKYVIGNVNGIRGLFNQMVPDELFLIRQNDFDYLWNYFWGTNEMEITFNRKEYDESKKKFTELKSNDLIESNLDFYLNNASPNYSTPEWGFPKGRKKKGESDLECAIREFCEETNLSESDINIIRNIKPIEEELFGTNGVKYKHIYFLAELKQNKTNIADSNMDISNLEIGDIGFFTFNECMDLIRDYHVEKKSILRCVMNYFIELFKKGESDKKEEWTCEMD